MIYRINNRPAFSLVEVTLALGVMSFCLAALLGLLPVGLASSQTSVEQTAAGNIANDIAADLLVTPLTSGTSTRLGFDMTASDGTPQTIFFAEDANPTGSVGAKAAMGILNSRYRASVALYPAAQKRATAVRILVTWPAQGDSAGTGWPNNFSGSFETVIALNRN